MANPSFSSLWSNYPTERSPCDGPWANQCAIRMSITLNAEGTLHVSSATYTDPKCSHGHARGAGSLADWLYGKQRLGRPTHTYSDSVTAKRDLAKKRALFSSKIALCAVASRSKIASAITLIYGTKVEQRLTTTHRTIRRRYGFGS
jgi:hypothetical protein